MLSFKTNIWNKKNLKSQFLDTIRKELFKKFQINYNIKNIMNQFRNQKIKQKYKEFKINK